MSDEEVEQLRAQLAELEQRNAELQTEGAPRRRLDGRGVAAWVLFLVAAILLPIAMTLFWAQRTLTDTERYVATVAPLAQDPTVQQAVADTATNAIMNQLDLQQRLPQVLPEQLQGLTGPISSAVEGFVSKQVHTVVTSDQFNQIWQALNRRMQQSLMKALEGDTSGPVTITNGQVVLDVADLVDQVKQALVARGLTMAQNLPTPPALDRQIVLLDSAELARAQSLYAVGQPVAQWLIWLVVLMLVGAILISRRRARMVLATGIAVVIAMVLLRIGVVVAGEQFALALQNTPFATAETAFFTILTSFLRTGIQVGFVIGLILIVGGWFAGRSASAAAARGFVSRLTGGAGSVAASGPLASVGEWVGRYRSALRWLVAVVAAVFLVVAQPLTVGDILWALAIVVVALIAIEVLTAAGVAAEPAVEDADEPTPVA